MLNGYERSQKILTAKIWFRPATSDGLFHTFFLITGGPAFPTTTEFVQMQTSMATIHFDTGGGVMRTMQNILDGFNVIVSIFLFTLPILSWLMLAEIGTNPRALRKLLVVNLLAIVPFFFTSSTLLAVGGTMISGIICLLLVASLVIYRN